MGNKKLGGLKMFNNLKILVNHLKEIGWIIDIFRFQYNGIRCIVLIKLFLENERKKNPYALAKIQFIKENDINDCIEIEADLYNLYFNEVRDFREFFNIEYSSHIGDIIKQFKEYFSKNIPIKPNNNINQQERILLYQSLNHEEEENKIYCYRLIRLGIKDGVQQKRSIYRDNKARLLRPSLYEKVKDDKTITFAFTDEECIEKNDEEILNNFYNN